MQTRIRSRQSNAASRTPTSLLFLLLFPIRCGGGLNISSNTVIPSAADIQTTTRRQCVRDIAAPPHQGNEQALLLA